MRKYNVKTELVTDGEVITPIEDEPSCSKKGRRKNTTTSYVEATGATSLVDLDRHSHIEFEQDADKVRLM